MTSLLVTDEAFVVLHVLSSVPGREVDLVDIHGIGIPSRPGGSCCLSRWNIAMPSTSELPELYHISVELSCLIKPLFPFPASLFLFGWEGGGSHHDSELVGHLSVKGVHQDAVEVDSTACLSQSEDSGILVKVTIELVHV